MNIRLCFHKGGCCVILLYIRLIINIILVIALCFSIVLFFKKRKRIIKFLCFVFSVLLGFILIFSFSDIYAFNLTSNDAVIIADSLGEKLDSITFNKKLFINFEDSFEDGKNMYWVYCAPYSDALLDEFVETEKFYFWAHENRYNDWNILIAPTIFHFDNSYFIGYHETPTQRILCYNPNVIIELKYTSYEYRNELWEGINFDYVLGPIREWLAGQSGQSGQSGDG